MRLPKRICESNPCSSGAIGMPHGVVPSACVNQTVAGGQACIDVPLIGSACLNAPGVPDLGTVSACCEIKTKRPFPGGPKIPYKVECCLQFQGQNIECKSWGL
jgi:hypothetical protein